MRQRPDAAALRERNRYAADLRACDLSIGAAYNSADDGAGPAAKPVATMGNTIEQA